MDLREVFNDTDVELESIHNLATALENIQLRILEEGISQSDVQEMRQYDENILDDRYPTAGFTRIPSNTNIKPALEAIDLKQFALIAGAVAAIISLITKFIGMLSGDSSGGGGLSASVAVLPEKAKETNDANLEKASEIDKKIADLEGNIKTGELVENAIAKVIGADSPKDIQSRLADRAELRVGLAFAFENHQNFMPLFSEGNGMANVTYSLALILGKIGDGMLKWRDYMRTNVGQMNANTRFNPEQFRTHPNSFFRFEENDLVAALAAIKTWDSGLYAACFGEAIRFDDRWNEFFKDVKKNFPTEGPEGYPENVLFQKYKDQGPWRGEANPGYREGLSKLGPNIAWGSYANGFAEFITQYAPKYHNLQFDMDKLLPKDGKGLEAHIDRLASRSTAAQVITGNAAFGFDEAEDNKVEKTLVKLRDQMEEFQSFYKELEKIDVKFADPEHPNFSIIDLHTKMIIAYSKELLTYVRDMIRSIGKMKVELKFISDAIIKGLEFQSKVLKELGKEVSDVSKDKDE